jgi:mono/diheme cytochrome c family protein
VLVTLLLVACGGGGDAGGGSGSEAAPAGAESELTAEQLAKGIGPITSLTLPAEVDAALAAQGQEIFTLKCSACHKLEARYVAPQLGGVLDRRTPEFVMNMILNPAEMTAKHPETKKLLAEFLLAMPNQNVTEAEARAVLEYIRSWKPE